MKRLQENLLQWKVIYLSLKLQMPNNWTYTIVINLTTWNKKLLCSEINLKIRNQPWYGVGDLVLPQLSMLDFGLPKEGLTSFEEWMWVKSREAWGEINWWTGKIIITQKVNIPGTQFLNLMITNLMSKNMVEKLGEIFHENFKLNHN